MKSRVTEKFKAKFAHMFNYVRLNASLNHLCISEQDCLTIEIYSSITKVILNLKKPN